LGSALEVPLEGVEAAGQLCAVGLEPVVEFSQRLDAHTVEPTLGIAADLDEAGVAQHLQVTGHAGLVHADSIDQLGDRTLADPQGVEDAATSEIGDHVEDGELAGHPLNIWQEVYMFKCRARGTVDAP
jgi:hypothetical protein